jgi:hypothetical protein
MKVVEDLQKSIDSLHANFQTFTQDIKRILARPPVNKIDPAEIAAAVKPILDDHLATIERMTARLEALEARIPKKLEYGLNESTRLLLYAMLFTTLGGLAIGYMLAPIFNQKYTDYQSEQLVDANRTIKQQDSFIEYFRARHPRDAAKYDRDHAVR